MAVLESRKNAKEIAKINKQILKYKQKIQDIQHTYILTLNFKEKDVLSRLINKVVGADLLKKLEISKEDDKLLEEIWRTLKD